GRPTVRAATLVGRDEPIALSARPRPYVSRGGQKLEPALDRFGVQVPGRLALDAGASTGGFTDCLLSRGAARVVAVDVGYGQLDWRLRQDPRVAVMERTNVRSLRPEDLPFVPQLVTADLSFISLRLVLPALAAVASVEADFVLLVKPQFEAGREQVGKGGVVSDPDAWSRVLRSTGSACLELGLVPADLMVSQLLGPAGNAEFFLWARRARSFGQGNPAAGVADLQERIPKVIGEALELRAGGG
ncbi:MAG: TlyA family RNA methyltransferase, partial [Actinobacteria bacterium]|nr:TlyA family RNA methyltransferase [Actinomycetota bacterium]